MRCGVGLCGHCQLREFLVCVDGPVLRPRRVRPHLGRCGSCDGRHRRPDRSWRSGSSPAATAASSPCSTARTSCSTLAGAVEIAYFPEATRAVVEGPYDLSLVEGSVTTADDAAADPAGAARLPAAGHDRRLRHRRRHPGAAQLRRRRRVHARSSTPTPSTSRRWRPRRPIAAHVPVDFELRGCPIDRAQLLEVARRVPAAAPAADLRRERVHGVQAARQRLRHGRPRHALPGSGHPRRVRRALPVVRPRLLRLLRARRRPRTRSRWPAGCATLGMPERDVTPGVPHLQRRGAGLRRGERPARAARRSVMTDEGRPADRELMRRDPGPGRGRGRDARRWCATVRSPTSSCRSTSRRGSSRRSCAGAGTPSRRTSPPGSAASARWPTR